MPGTKPLLALLFLLLTLLTATALAQKPSPRPDDGAVTAGAYQNNFFGFEYKLPAGFEDHTAAMPKTGAGITYGLLHASEPKQATRAASSVTLFADDAKYWQSKSGADYLDKVSAQMAKRADLVGKMTPLTIGGHQFFRQDFKPHAAFAVRQTIIATVMKGWVLSAVLTAADPAGIDALVAGFRATRFTNPTSKPQR